MGGCGAAARPGRSRRFLRRSTRRYNTVARRRPSTIAIAPSCCVTKRRYSSSCATCTPRLHPLAPATPLSSDTLALATHRMPLRCSRSSSGASSSWVTCCRRSRAGGRRGGPRGRGRRRGRSRRRGDPQQSRPRHRSGVCGRGRGRRSRCRSTISGMPTPRLVSSPPSHSHVVLLPVQHI